MRDPEDEAAVVVEQMLSSVVPATQYDDVAGRKAVATHALGICACISFDWSPSWLIYTTAEGQLVWSRVPDGKEVLGQVDASQTAGGHADPTEVLKWLRGEASDPWSGGGDGASDPGVLEVLRMTILRSV